MITYRSGKSFAWLPLIGVIPLCACVTIGPQRLAKDEIDYSRSLSDFEKQQMLLNVVRLRYAEAPIFIDLTQIISGYQLQRNLSGSFEAFPRAGANSYLGGSGSVQQQESPTFTYQPLTGDQFADSLLRPLSPAAILPLALGGLPIDTLFRLVVQSINGLNNAALLTGNAGAGSAEFFELLHLLRQLQIAGLLDVRIEHGAKPGDTKTAAPPHVFATIRVTQDAALSQTGLRVRQLLGLRADAREFEVIYGRTPAKPGGVAILTRSMLGVLGELANGVDAPAADLASGRTVPTVPDEGGGRLPVIIHSGPRKESDSFVEIYFGGTLFWISQRDFSSKIGFSLVQILLALARTSHGPSAVLTIPAG